MATRMQQRRGTASQWISSNDGDGPILNAGEIGWESDTNKFKIGDGTSYWADLTYFVDATDVIASSLGAYLQDSDVGAASGVAGLDSSKNLLVPGASIIVEGATDNAFETTLTVTDPTADRTITFPDAGGTVVLSDGSGNVTVSGNLTVQGTTTTVDSTTINVVNSFTFEGSTADAFETTLTVTDPTADRTITLPDATGTVVLTTTLDEMAQDAVNTAIVAGTGLDKTYDDNANTITLDIDSTVTTNSGTQTLTNKTLTSPVINTPTGITKSDVGLGNVDNTSDANKPVSTATQTELNLKAPLASPTFTGTVTLPTGTVTSAMILDGTIVAGDLADGAVTSGKILDGTIVNADINASAAIDKTKISGTAITAGDTGTVTSTMIADGTIVNSDINASAAIALSKLATDPLARANHTGTQTASTISDFDTQVRASKVTDLTAPTGSFSMNSQKITSLATPTADADAATKAYVDAATAGLNVHASVQAATTANVTLASALENGDTLDGVTLATGNRVLVKNQTDKTQNGIYVVKASGTPDRADDYNTTPEVDAGDFVFVEAGTINGKTGWMQTNIITTIGSDNIEFTQFSGAGTYLAGTGLTLTGNTFSINTGTTVDLNTAQTLTNKTLTSPTITGTGAIAGTFTGNLTGNVTGNVSGNAGTVTNGVYTTDTGTVTSTMIANGTIVDADINASAAIAQSKVSGLTTDLAAKAPLASPTFTGTVTIPNGAALGTPTSLTLTNATGLPVSTGISGLGTGIATALATNTGSAGAPVLFNGALGTPTSATLTNATGLPVASGISGLGTGVATFLASPTAANLASMVTDEIGSGSLMFSELPTNAQSASYTLVLADKMKIVEMNVGSANNLTVPLNASVAFPVGTQINIVQTGSGQTTVVATGGVTINTATTLKLRAQWSAATLIKRAENTWVLVGDLATS